MVISKTIEYQPRNQSLAVPSDSMSAFDWGIRFEPVVKQLYEHKYAANVKELGRLYHPTDPRCAASPDGLVYDTNPPNDRIGRLIEIKCPVTRVMNGKIPKDYYTQMQLQMHVTGCSSCDYIEAEFSSIYNDKKEKTGQAEFSGIIALVQRSALVDNQEYYYIYGPINDNSWAPTNIPETDEIRELIPWRLIQWSEQNVLRSESWWDTIKPIIDEFWIDVERAKRGEFIAPESSRPTKKRKADKCDIIITKLDENGNE